ncbi:MAG: hypothetical protein AAF645_22845, partial [Myxococcota bacterium]
MIDDDDDFDLDSALDAWAEDFDRNTSQFPPAPDAAPSVKQRESERPTSPPPSERPLASEYPLFDEGDEDVSTRVAPLPQGLLGSLGGEVDLEGLFGEVGAPTAPTGNVDGDVDALLFDLGDDTLSEDELESGPSPNDAVTVVQGSTPPIPMGGERRPSRSDAIAPPPLKAGAIRTVPPPVTQPSKVPRPAEGARAKPAVTAFGGAKSSSEKLVAPRAPK